MIKPTETEIRTASDKQLAEWSAMYLKKWKLCDKGIHWLSQSGTIQCLKKDWNPAQNIGQAFELVKKVKSFSLHKFNNEWTAIIGHIITGYIWREAKAKMPALAITKTALLAVVGG